jgi:hypothetical protein
VTFFVPVFWSLFIPLAAVLLWAIVDKVRDDAHWRQCWSFAAANSAALMSACACQWAQGHGRFVG